MPTGNIDGHMWGLKAIVNDYLATQFLEAQFCNTELTASQIPLFVATDCTDPTGTDEARLAVVLLDRRDSLGVYRLDGITVSALQVNLAGDIGCGDYNYTNTVLFAGDTYTQAGFGCDPLCALVPSVYGGYNNVYILTISPVPSPTAPRSIGWEYAVAYGTTDKRDPTLAEIWAAVLDAHQPDQILVPAAAWDTKSGSDTGVGYWPFDPFHVRKAL